MSLIDDVAKLLELEQQATPGKWYKAEKDEGDCDEINGRMQSWDTGVTVYDRELGVFHPEKVKIRCGPEEFEDEYDMESICAPDKEPNAEFIATSRNLAPAMLEVLECFEPGYAKRLSWILINYPHTLGEENCDMLRRFKQMSALMEKEEQG